MVSRRSLLAPLAMSIALALAGSLLAGIPAGEPGRTYFAGTSMTIAVDGDFSDEAWQLAPRHSHTNKLSAQALREGRVETDASPDDDAAFEFGALADAEWLYVAVWIRDEALVWGEAPGCDVWSDDSVEIFIDPDASGGSTYDAGDSQITIPLENLGRDPAAPKVCGLQHPTQGVRAAVVQTPDGWAVEAAIALGIPGRWNIVPADGGRIGFEIGLNDDDDGGDEDTFLTSSASDFGEAWRSPDVFARFVFASLPTVIHVPRDYATIQEAVDASPPGGTVFVSSGTFDEAVVIRRSLRLSGLVPGLPDDVDPADLPTYPLPVVRAAAGGISIDASASAHSVTVEKLSLLGGNTGVRLSSETSAVQRCFVAEILDKNCVGASGIAAHPPCSSLEVTSCYVRGVTGCSELTEVAQLDVYGIHSDRIPIVVLRRNLIAECKGARITQDQWSDCQQPSSFNSIGIALTAFKHATITGNSAFDITGGSFSCGFACNSAAEGVVCTTDAQGATLNVNDTRAGRITTIGPFMCPPASAIGLRVEATGSGSIVLSSNCTSNDIVAGECNRCSSRMTSACGILCRVAGSIRASAIEATNIIGSNKASPDYGWAGDAYGILLQGVGEHSTASIDQGKVQSCSGGGSTARTKETIAGDAYGIALRDFDRVDIINCDVVQVMGGNGYGDSEGGDGYGGNAVGLDIVRCAQLTIYGDATRAVGIHGGVGVGGYSGGGDAKGVYCDIGGPAHLENIRVFDIRGGWQAWYGGGSAKRAGNATGIVVLSVGATTIQSVELQKCIGGSSGNPSVGICGDARGLMARARSLTARLCRVLECEGGDWLECGSAQKAKTGEAIGIDVSADETVFLDACQVTNCRGGNGREVAACGFEAIENMQGGQAIGMRVCTRTARLFNNLCGYLEGGAGATVRVSQPSCGDLTVPGQGGDATGIALVCSGEFDMTNLSIVGVCSGFPGGTTSLNSGHGPPYGPGGKSAGMSVAPGANVGLRNSIILSITGHDSDGHLSLGPAIVMPGVSLSEDHNCFYQYSTIFEPGGSRPGLGDILADARFWPGPAGEFYLMQRIEPHIGTISPCVDAGSAPASRFGLDGSTTAPDLLPDIGIVDIGFHYPRPGTSVANLWLSPPIQAFCRSRLPVFMRSHQDVRGFTWGLTYDSSAARIEEILQGHDLETAGVDFFLSNTSPAPCADGRTGATLAAIVSLQPPLRTLPADANLEIAAFVVRGKKTGEVPLDFVGCLGDPPVEVVLTTADGSITPETRGGILRFSGVCYVRGDVNPDGRLDISDPIKILYYIFANEAISCVATADSNGDGAVDIGDAIYLLSYEFVSGPPPPEPFPDCGGNSGAAGVPCDAYSACSLK